MVTLESYKPQQFNLSGLKGISDQTLEMHFTLYEGYVQNTNILTEKIAEILKDGKIDHEETPAYSELTRRLGFEYNGMCAPRILLREPDLERRRRSRARLGLPARGRGKLRPLRHLEGGLHRDREDARRRLGDLLSGSHERQALESLDHTTRGRQCVWVHTALGDGRMGACVPARLQAGGAAEVLRGIIRLRQLAGVRGALASRGGRVATVIVASI